MGIFVNKIREKLKLSNCENLAKNYTFWNGGVKMSIYGNGINSGSGGSPTKNVWISSLGSGPEQVFTATKGSQSINSEYVSELDRHKIEINKNQIGTWYISGTNDSVTKHDTVDINDGAVDFFKQMDFVHQITLHSSISPGTVGNLNKVAINGTVKMVQEFYDTDPSSSVYKGPWIINSNKIEIQFSAKEYWCAVIEVYKNGQLIKTMDCVNHQETYKTFSYQLEIEKTTEIRVQSNTKRPSGVPSTWSGLGAAYYITD